MDRNFEMCFNTFSLFFFLLWTLSFFGNMKICVRHQLWNIRFDSYINNDGFWHLFGPFFVGSILCDVWSYTLHRANRKDCSHTDVSCSFFDNFIPLTGEFFLRFSSNEPDKQPTMTNSYKKNVEFFCATLIYKQITATTKRHIYQSFWISYYYHRTILDREMKNLQQKIDWTKTERKQKNLRKN